MSQSPNCKLRSIILFEFATCFSYRPKHIFKRNFFKSVFESFCQRGRIPLRDRFKTTRGTLGMFLRVKALLRAYELVIEVFNSA